MSADQLAELIERLPPESRVVVERLVAMLAAGGSGSRPAARWRLLEIPRVDGPGRTGEDIDREIRDERASWADR